ncbi:FAD-dependent oxidoreductase [uncultured Roseovarius sp.]|uniref:GcvT family protein n=1 Tax=uncultured Roseovarius sp. TaxID=293344 RepID=UPI00262E2874|nr:FAD-dependent oxidoreductase [uncultured Roseovarius sp.]
MAEIPGTARAVIIGGGAVGASCLYHLAKAGWTDSVLLERNELTAGSTWHAAGNVPTFSTSWSVMNMQRYSTELYARLGSQVDYPMNYHQTGSIRLAHSRERMQEFERAKGMGRHQGMDLEILGVDEIKARYPFIETHDVKGALYDPNDGDIDPAQLTQALAKGAREMGARVIRFCPAMGVRRENGEWIVETEKGEIRCEIVVNAAGYYAQRVGEWFKPYGGRTVPMMVMSHQYLLSEEIPEIEAWSKEQGRKLPLLRDVDVSYYLRQEKHGFNLGPYEPRCRAHWVDPSDPMPDDFSFQLWQEDIDRIEEIVTDAMARVPLLGTSGISKIINGPIPYAPDGMPLLGPMPGVPNAFEACVFTFGIAQGGGAGKVLAEWITEGAPEWDMWSCDPRRYTDYTDPEYCVAKGMEVYGHEYGMHFPWHRWPVAPDRRVSALHERLKSAGAQMGAYNGWERANWFAQPGDDTSEEATQTWDRAGPWEARIRQECEAVRDHAGVIAISGFTRIAVQGPGARDHVDGLTASRLPQPGRIGLAYFGDDRGRILTEMSVIPRSEDEIWLITAGAAQWHDRDVLARGLPEGVTLTDRSDRYDCLLVTGPKARGILGPLTDADLSLPWLSVQDTTVCGVGCVLIRVSFAGELGWEIHCPAAEVPVIWDAVTDAGAKPFGMWALNSLRIEKGYRAWKGDLSTDYSLLEGGLERFVKLDKPQEFPGKAALLAEKQRGVAKRFAPLIVEAGAADAPYMSSIWHGGEIVGETTSGAWGYRVNGSVALAMLRSDLAVPRTKLEVEIFGERVPATVQPDAPLWDPQNERLKA